MDYVRILIARIFAEGGGELVHTPDKDNLSLGYHLSGDETLR